MALEPHGTTWHHLSSPGVTWHNLAPPGTTWHHLGLPGITWGYLAPAWVTWHHLAPPGTTWHLQELGYFLYFFTLSWVLPVVVMILCYTGIVITIARCPRGLGGF